MNAVALGASVGLAAGTLIAVAALFGVWWERKVAGRIQLRFGPQEAGPAGLLQTLADTVKLVLKEDITPDGADVTPFRVAPLVVFVPIAVSLAFIPFAAGWAPIETPYAVILYLGVPAISVIGILMAGWASRNAYATIGGLRGAAQMISYEIPRTITVLSICVLAGGASIVDITGAWRWWWIPLNAVGFIVYVISSIAELNRGPFDLPEAESELVAGYFADYSGIRWAVFMMAEYGGIVSAALFGSCIFFGRGLGMSGPLGAILFLILTVALITVFVWAKWTFPRMRPDQLMRLAWVTLTPLALLQLLVTGVVAAWM